MKISQIEIKNYKSIENLVLDFNASYNAICGKNDSGKSNIIKAIRAIFKPDDFFYREDDRILFKEHFPVWKSERQNESIKISITICISSTEDIGLYKFIEKFTEINDKSNTINLILETEITNEKKLSSQVVFINQKKCEEYASQEILNKIISSKLISICNSTEPEGRYFLRRRSGPFIKSISDLDKKKLDDQKSKLNRIISTLAKKHQKDITDLFGKLAEKYNVGLSVPKFNFENVSFDITLGDKDIYVPLDDWGCGTRNKTSILLSFLAAKQIMDSDDISKITPILIIEEPESFLHPSAQAAFARLLQDLAYETKIQIILTTHSPYFLSQDDPSSNILLERKFERKKLRETVLVETVNDNWMEPYALALGIINKEFMPWKNLIFSKSNKLLLVEGQIDADYFLLLRGKHHDEHSLDEDIEIYPYGGKDNLKNNTLLRFIQNRYKKLFITFDIDAKEAVVGALMGLGLQERVNFIGIGQNGKGKDNIEGLLPSRIKNAVNAVSSDLVDQLSSGNTATRNSAKQALKQKYLEEFKKNSKPKTDDYNEFYKLTKIINSALNR